MATTKKQQPSLEVWLDDPAFGPLQQIGTLHKIGPDGVRFADAAAWLRNPVAFQFDPALSLDAGDFYPADSNSGVCLDSCPVRWGHLSCAREDTGHRGGRHARDRRVAHYIACRFR